MHLAAKTMIPVKFKIQNSKFKIPAAGRRGLTMMELMIAMTISTVLILVVGVLLAAGQRCWSQTYDLVNQQIKQDALATTATFGSVGRKANRTDYFLYAANDGAFSPVEPQTSDREVVYGDAVEFRYWDVELDETDSHQLMDVTKRATAYAFFYLDDDKLKVDYGPYPPGAVPAGGGSRNTTGVTTTILAENVTPDPNTGAFSHTTISRIGQGCVRINITLTDPVDGDSVTVKTATLMRNIWPR
jgi:prepilin-type N-terminal cleavage/methylation domain-containing protein